jgi:hypothetical protein
VEVENIGQSRKIGRAGNYISEDYSMGQRGQFGTAVAKIFEL